MSKPKVLIDLAEYERLKSEGFHAPDTRQAFEKVLRVLGVDPDLDAERTKFALLRLKCDAELGKLVRQMSWGTQLWRTKFGNRWEVVAHDHEGSCQTYASPEEALRAAIEVKDANA